MENKYTCPNCHTSIMGKSKNPFCSERCETIFLDHAPLKSIDAVYSEYKLSQKTLTEKYVNELYQ